MWRALYLVEIFQSTLSVRRATPAARPSPQGADISIHALRKESDAFVTFRDSCAFHFNPRSP